MWKMILRVFISLLFLHCIGSEKSFVTQNEASDEVEEIPLNTPQSIVNGSTSPRPLFPWLENMVHIDGPDEREDKPEVPLTDMERQLLSNDTETVLRSVIPDNIPDNLNKMLNQTALKRMRDRQRKANETEDELMEDDEEIDEDLNKPVFDGEKTTIKITSDAGEQLHQHWLDQGISGLMATYATQKLNKASKQAKVEHRKCARSSKTVTAHAKCVLKLIQSTKKKPMARKINRVLKLKKLAASSKLLGGAYVKKSKYYEPKRMKREIEDEEKPRFRPSLKVVNKDSYNLLDQHNHAPFAILAKKLTAAVRSFKNKDNDSRTWQETLDEIRSEAKRMRQKNKAKKMMKKRMDMIIKAGQNIKDGKDAMQDITNEIAEEDEKPKSEREELMEEALELEKQMTTKDKMLHAPIKLIRQGVKLGMALTGHDTSDFDNKTLNMISPKFMSLVEEEEQQANGTINLLSPSLLALHNGTKNEAFSLSSLMNIFNKDEGHQEWMNFVFEASGVSDAVQFMKANEQKKEKEEVMGSLRDKSGRQNYFTKENITKISGEYEKRKIETMETLNGMYTKEQLDAMNTTGYVVMNRDQVHFIYGEDSPYNNSKAFERYINRTERHSHRSIEKTIEMIAKEEMAYKVIRKRDFVLTPVIMSPIILNAVGASQSLILSPVLLTPVILSPSIWGNVILSPWAFVPVIVSPRILGAVVLSPILFSPVVLSPLAMTPVILSPGVGLTIILSPFVLTPFILSPVVLTPVILSPFALSPFIAVPNVLTPLILSPFVLSPLILSPPAFSAFVLTPYALSPIIKSDGAAFFAVLSPSWLS